MTTDITECRATVCAAMKKVVIAAIKLNEANMRGYGRDAEPLNDAITSFLEAGYGDYLIESPDADSS
jgi:hypothetical protein